VLGFAERSVIFLSAQGSAVTDTRSNTTSTKLLLLLLTLLLLYYYFLHHYYLLILPLPSTLNRLFGVIAQFWPKTATSLWKSLTW